VRAGSHRNAGATNGDVCANCHTRSADSNHRTDSRDHSRADCRAFCDAPGKFVEREFIRRIIGQRHHR
jgi:hypothetical protein